MARRAIENSSALDGAGLDDEAVEDEESVIFDKIRRFFRRGAS